MNEAIRKPRCALTGAHGYLGGLIARKLITSGWDVLPLVRTPKPGEIAFTLGEAVAADALSGCDALLHCAYDFGQVAWRDIVRVNVDGSQRLFMAAAAAKVPSTLLISTISAFEGCKSKSGRAKLLIEAHAREIGACVLRPGLVYGASPGAMFGRLVQQVRASSLVPVPGDGRQLQYTVHEDDLTEAIVRALTALPAPSTPVTAAHETPISFSDIIRAIGARLGRRVTLLPTPWQAMWLALVAAENVGLRLRLRSDSLISLMNQDPSPNLNAEAALGVRCRPFDLASVSL